MENDVKELKKMRLQREITTLVSELYEYDYRKREDITYNEHDEQERLAAEGELTRRCKELIHLYRN